MPAGRVTSRTASRLSGGRAKAPTWVAAKAMSAGLVGTEILSDEWMTALSALKISRMGRSRTPVTLKLARVGPMARTSSVAGALPPMAKPLMSAAVPLPTKPRVERLTRLPLERAKTQLLEVAGGEA